VIGAGRTVAEGGREVALVEAELVGGDADGDPSPASVRATVLPSLT